MKQRTRKFIGVWMILALLIIYPLTIAVVYAEKLFWMPTWMALIFFLITGLFWAVPAGMIIKWMVKPDAKAKS